MLRMTTNLTAREAEFVRYLQLALRAVGRDINLVVTKEGDELQIDRHLVVTDTTFPKKVIGGTREVPGWFIGRLVSYPGSYMEPPDVDVAEIDVVESTAAAAHAALAVYLDDLIGRSMEAEAEREMAEEERRLEAELQRLGCEGWRCSSRECPVHGAEIERGLEGRPPDGDYDPDYFARRNRAALRRAGL